MKHILIKQYDNPWRISELNYESELRSGVSEEEYLLIRNATASVNSFEIVDLEVDEEKQTISCQSRFWSYQHAPDTIREIMKFFKASFDKQPNVLKVSAEAFQKVKGIPGSDIKVSIDQELKKFEYRLVYDEQTS